MMLSLFKELSFETRSWKPSASFKNLNESMSILSSEYISLAKWLNWVISMST